MEKNLMLAFVSPVNPFYLREPINYEIFGRPYSAIQTNEAAIVYVERMLENSLSKIFLIASDHVKTAKVLSENEFGDVTHLEFLRRRVTKEFPSLAEKFSVQNYSDGAAALEKNILQTAEIADAVIKFARENPADKIIVHADMTGGFRHASMLMLSIIQLLRYRGVEIGEVLYSDPTAKTVYSVTEIQRMFTLITGADEFVKFGSVEALRDYFGKNPPPAVKDLLEAMNRFSEAIKICRTSAIESELKNLGRHIQTFRENPDKDLKSELFAKIIDTIEREYGGLIGGTSERLEIIRWCMRKGFWQQVMTLCTEWLPEEIVARKIFKPTNAAIIKVSETRSRALKTWQQYFITDYTLAEKPADKTVSVNEFCQNLRDALKKFPSQNSFAELKNFFDEYTTGELSFGLCRSGKILVTAFKRNFPTLAAVLQAILDERKKSVGYRKNFYEFLQTIDYKKIPSLVAYLPAEKILSLFKIDRAQITSKNSSLAAGTWANREKVYRKLFDKKFVYSALDEESALKFLHGYHEIRRERNQVNHANAQASKKISDLQPMIENYLAALEKIPVNSTAK